ncbi:MAG: signal peptidase II, partial [Victivallaceae bacterium]|nr:signal peptidase II [Victivallaceae bacterium]
MINLFARSMPHSRSERRIIVFSVIVAGLLLLADQVSKVVVADRFRLGESVLVVKNFFSLTYVTNEGAAWGIMTGYGWLLLVVAAAVTSAAIFLLRWLTEGFNERYLALTMVVSGIIGNSIDR